MKPGVIILLKRQAKGASVFPARSSHQPLAGDGYRLASGGQVRARADELPPVRGTRTGSNRS